MILMDKKRILVISSVGTPTPNAIVKPDGSIDYSYSGLEQLCWFLSKELKHRGRYDVTVVASFDSLKELYDKEGIEFIPTVPARILNIPERESWIIAYEKLKKVAEFDLIHDMSHTGCVYMDMFRAERDGQFFPPIVKTVHDQQPFGSPPPVKFPRMCGVSHEHALNLSRSLGIPVIGVPNGVPKELYNFKAEKSERYLTLGRIQHLKGIDTAISIALAAGVPLDVVGDDTHIPNDPYVHRIKRMCDGKQIRYIGKVTHEQKAEFLANAKATILCSNFLDPFNLIVPESNLCGSSVLAFKMGGLRETTIDGVTGFLGDTSEDLIRRIENGDVNKIKPSDCRQHAINNYTVEKMVDRYEFLYDKILNDGFGW